MIGATGADPTARSVSGDATLGSTGGHADIGRFTFDWHHLRAQIHNFVIHGSEPANVPPLFSARLVQVDLKLTSPFGKIVDIAYLLADTPQALAGIKGLGMSLPADGSDTESEV